MKPFYLLFLMAFCSLAVQAQILGGLSYSLSIPQRAMKDNIKPSHGASLTFLSHFKKANKLSWGLEGGISQYAGFTKDQDIRFPDGSGVNTKVTYSSNIVTAALLTRYNFLKDTKVNPYLSGKLGYANFFSRVVVADPEHEDDCKPLDKKKPISDHSFFGAFGGGLLIDISSPKQPKNVWIDFSINWMHGTSLNYVNVKDIKEQINSDPANPTPVTDKTAPLTVRFVNVATNTIHEHQLAEVYTSPLRLMEIKVGVIWRLDN